MAVSFLKLKGFKNYLVKKERNIFPPELLVEIINFLPFNFKWVDKRISTIFDPLLLKNLRKWVIYCKKVVDPLQSAIKASVVLLESLSLTDLQIIEVHGMNKVIGNIWNVVWDLPMVYGWHLDNTTPNKFTQILTEWQKCMNPSSDEFTNVVNQKIKLVVRLLNAIHGLNNDVFGGMDDSFLIYTNNSLREAMKPLNN